MNEQQYPKPYYRSSPPPPAPVKPTRKRKLRLFWLLIPASLWLLSYVCSNVDPVISWSEIMRLLNVQDTKMYSQLFVLAVIAVTVVIIFKILKRPNK